MKILFLPSNIASIPTNTAKAMNRISGINAKCLFTFSHKFHDSDKSVITLPDKGSRLNFIRWTYRYIKNLRTIKQLVNEADVLHYFCGTAVYGGIDLKWAHRKKKPVFIEWLGSDIRNPALLFSVNKYYKTVFENGYEYKTVESSNNKKKVQQRFHNAGAIAVACPEIHLYIDRNLFPEIKLLFQRLDLKEFIPQSTTNNTKPLVLHSPSAQNAKGTGIILKTIEHLKNKYDFDFVLLKNVSRKEVLTLMKQADIFIDQIIIGGYGMAALEAMAFGKPVMCYLIPEVFEAGLPIECPIVNTNPDNLEEKLEKLLNNVNLRGEIGVQSRNYVEKYHDADKISLQLIEMYQKELDKHN